MGRGLLAGALGAAAWSTLIEPRLFTVRRHTLPVLASGRTPLRVLHISDLHLAPWQHAKIAWVRGLAELRPDLVILTGDQLGHRFARGSLLHALQPFADAGIATAFVHGSNDYFSPVVKNPLNYLRAPSSHSARQPDIDNAALTAAFEARDFINLNNSAARITLRGNSVELLGLNDPHIGYDDTDALDASLSALPPLQDESAQLKIGVVHAPYQRSLGQLLDRGSEVIFAGHTHGGQVRVPGIGALTANCDLPTAQARGLSVWYDAENAAFLNVSAGLGGSIYSNIRFACRPEVSLLTLEATDDSYPAALQA